MLRFTEGFWIHEGLRIQSQVLLLGYRVYYAYDATLVDHRASRIFTHEKSLLGLC